MLYMYLSSLKLCHVVYTVIFCTFVVYINAGINANVEFTLDKELQVSYIHSNEFKKSTGAPGGKVPIDRKEHGEIHSNIKVS